MSSVKQGRAIPSSAPALTDARSSWSRGDFDGCLVLLDAIGTIPSGSEAWVEGTLLRARSLYRLKRYAEVVALLEPTESGFAPGDESCTARLLLGSSITRSGDFDRGLEMLEATALQAEAPGVHAAVRTEITHARALAHWTRRELDAAEGLARQAEAAGATSSPRGRRSCAVTSRWPSSDSPTPWPYSMPPSMRIGSVASVIPISWRRRSSRSHRSSSCCARGPCPARTASRSAAAFASRGCDPAGRIGCSDANLCRRRVAVRARRRPRHRVSQDAPSRRDGGCPGVARVDAHGAGLAR